MTMCTTKMAYACHDMEYQFQYSGLSNRLQDMVRQLDQYSSYHQSVIIIFFYYIIHYSILFPVFYLFLIKIKQTYVFHLLSSFRHQLRALEYLADTSDRKLKILSSLLNNSFMQLSLFEIPKMLELVKSHYYYNYFYFAI